MLPVTSVCSKIFQLMNLTSGHNIKCSGPPLHPIILLFTSGVTPKYTNMLVYFGVTPDAKPKVFVTPDANPRRQSVEYRWRWVFWRWPCIFHVYFMYISCCLCILFRVGYAKIGRRKPSFQWNMGFGLHQIRNK